MPWGGSPEAKVCSQLCYMTLNKSFHFPEWKGVYLREDPTWPCWATRQNVTIISQLTPWTFRDPPKHNAHHRSSLSRADHQPGWVVQKVMVTALLHHWMFSLQSLLHALDNGTLEERVSWLQSVGPRAQIHHFHPGIAPQRTGKFSCFGNVDLERISCHWQAALFLHCKCNWNRVPNFTPISHLTSNKLP